MRGTRFRDTLHGGGGFATPDVFQPLAGNDFVLGGSAITFVDMGAAPDGADKVLGLQGTIVSYAKRTNPIRPQSTSAAPTTARPARATSCCRSAT